MFSDRQRILILFVVIIGLIEAGCTSLPPSRCWYQEGKSFQQTVRDYNIATAEAVKSPSTRDNTSMTLHGYPYSWNLPSGLHLDINYDAGGRDVSGVRYYIMKAMGYRLVSVAQLPQIWRGYDLGKIAD